MSKKPSPAMLAAVVAAAAGAAAIAMMPKAPMPIDHGSDPGVAGAASTAAPAAEPAAAMPVADAGKEECFGVAKAGENDCAAANGTHTCGGMAKVDFSGFEFKNVDAGTCVKMGGKLEAFDNTANPQAPKPN